MGCSCYGIISICFSSIGTLFVTLALIFPLWTTDQGFIDHTIFDASQMTLSADFAAGVWGICNTLTLHVDGSEIVGGDVKNCYYYYSPSTTMGKYVYTSDVQNPILKRTFDPVALCDFKESNPPFSFPDYMMFSPPDKELTAFLTNVCGVKGKASLGFSVLAVVFGCMALVFFLFGISCCKKNSMWIKVGHFLNSLTSFSALVALILWVLVASPLHSEPTATRYSVSFYVELLSVLCFLITSVLVSRHVRQGDVTQQGVYYRDVTKRGHRVVTGPYVASHNGTTLV